MNKTAEVVEIQHEKAIQKYELTPERVNKMASEYMGLTVIREDAESYGVARKALTTCVKARTGTDARRKELTKEARQWQTDVNQAAKDLLAPLAPVEEHLKAELRKEEDRKEAIREEKRNKEIMRIAGIQEKIAEIEKHGVNLHLIGRPEMLAKRDYVGGLEISLEEYQEFAQQAKTVKETTLAAIIASYDALVVQAKADEARKVENERLERIRKEQEAEAARLKKIADEQAEKLNAEQKKIDDEKAAIQAEKDRIEADKKDEQERIDREKFEAQAKEDARIQAEKNAKEKAEREEREAVEKEEAEIAEMERLKALQPDKDLLLNYLSDTFPLQGVRFKSQKATELFDKFQEDLVNLIEALKTDIEKL